jgi:hypothetical protein
MRYRPDPLSRLSSYRDCVYRPMMIGDPRVGGNWDDETRAIYDAMIAEKHKQGLWFWL